MTGTRPVPVCDYTFRTSSLRLLALFALLPGLMGAFAFLAKGVLSGLGLIAFSAASFVGLQVLRKRLTRQVLFFEDGLELRRHKGSTGRIPWSVVGEPRQVKRGKFMAYEVSLGTGLEPLHILPAVEGAKSTETLLSIIRSRRRLDWMENRPETTTAVSSWP